MENQSVKIDELVDNVKSFLALMEDGDISASPYDTAWVALIDDIHQAGVSQFPSSLSWIVNNQSMDGSWGYDRVFMVSDRLINTLACIIALKKWNIYPCKYEKGLKFVRDNISRVGDGNVEHMLSAFEVVFPPLLDMARNLHIELPDCSTALSDVCAKRNLKLSRISKERMHKVPTTLLYSLEGVEGPLDWEKLLKLQHEDGSFMTSPSSTAFAFMETKDNNCLSYLNKVTQRFNGGVPTLYPIDLFEQVWAVDRLQRLGISRFFKDEIDEIIGNLQRCWTKDGISWTRYSRLHDTDCIGMGFRLLRLKGYQVSSDVFKGSKKGVNGEFVCYEGQWNEGISVMSSLYRASQLLFPQEQILHEAKKFSSKFLRRKQIDNKVIDKWLIPKDLPGEVAFLLDVPWYTCLPRLEASFFIEQYGGDDVVWIGKTLYRVPYIDNNMYLELAKADYNNCQALHRDELKQIHDWYQKCEFEDFGVAKNNLVLAYFLASATIFEPERSIERLAWAKTAMLLKAVTSYFDMDNNKYVKQRISSFTTHFQKFVAARNYNKSQSEFEMKTTEEKLIHVLLTSLNQFSRDAMTTYGEDIIPHLYRSWEKWLLKWQDMEDEFHGDSEVLVNTINLMAGRTSSSKGWFYDRISNLMNKICSHLVNHQKTNNVYISEVDEKRKGSYRITTPQIECEMEELVEMVLNNSSDNMDFDMKQTFLAVTKTFYYAAFFDAETIKSHIARVLFQKVT